MMIVIIMTIGISMIMIIVIMIVIRLIVKLERNSKDKIISKFEDIYSKLFSCVTCNFSGLFSELSAFYAELRT